MAEDDQNRRNPRNLQGLLKFAMEATKEEDPTHPSQFEEMDPERRRFLEEALKALTIDVVEELNKAMKILIERESTKEDQVSALEIVQDFIEDIDTANDFYKINGFLIIMPCLNSPYKEVRSGTASLIATLAQNNPFCQQHLMELNILPKLVELLSDEPDVTVRAVHAISCLVRSYEPALAAYIEIGGLECTLGLLQNADNEKIVVKSAFLVNALCDEWAPVRDQFVKLNAVERIIRTIEPCGEYNQKLEILLSSLMALTENTDGIDRCRESGMRLKEKLEEIIRLSGGKDECLEQIEYCNTLLNRCFRDESETER